MCRRLAPSYLDGLPHLIPGAVGRFPISLALKHLALDDQDDHLGDLGREFFLINSGFFLAFCLEIPTIVYAQPTAQGRRFALLSSLWLRLLFDN